MASREPSESYLVAYQLLLNKKDRMEDSPPLNPRRRPFNYHSPHLPNLPHPSNLRHAVYLSRYRFCTLINSLTKNTDGSMT